MRFAPLPAPLPSVSVPLTARWWRRFHAGCHAEDPTGLSSRGPNELLRAICILSMAPARLIAPFPEVQEARRRAYELDVFSGGSCMGNLDEDGVPQRAISFLKEVEEKGEENVRNFEDAPLAVQRCIDPWYNVPKL